MAENLVINGVTYPAVESIEAKNESGQSIKYHRPNSKTYTITLAKSSGWVLLTQLDQEVLDHINDESLVVTLINMSEHVYAWYCGYAFMATNHPTGLSGEYYGYGYSNRRNTETSTSSHMIFYKANDTSTDLGIGGYGRFRLNGGKYYIRPSDGFVAAGDYRLTFTW